MMRRLLIALTALVMLGGVAGGAMAQNTATGGQSAQEHPDNEQNPANQLPGCNPSDQQPNKCPGDNGGGGGGGPKSGTCEDGQDNEPDGYTDGADPDCQKPGCKPSSQTPNKCDETNDDSACGAGNDDDGDGRCDGADNCPSVANANQHNSDSDTLGDACDNCDTTTNQNQADSDHDGIGDACESGPCDSSGGDVDADGVCGNVDNCPTTANPGQADTDTDGIGDACDTPAPAVNQCTAATNDPGILTDDTLGQTLWDGGLQVSPLTEDPEADGPLSGAIYDGGNGSPLEPLTDEVSCAVDLLLDGPALGFDL